VACALAQKACRDAQRMIPSHPRLRRQVAEYLALLMILASYYRYRRSKHLISNLFPVFFSSLLGFLIA
jgi:hypothetical protein